MDLSAALIWTLWVEKLEDRLPQTPQNCLGRHWQEISDGAQKCERECAACDGVTDMINLLPCKTCDSFYHPSCVNMLTDVFHTLSEILPDIGWVCNGCIDTISVKRKSLSCEMDDMSGTIQQLQHQISSLSKKFDELSVSTKNSQSTSVGLPASYHWCIASGEWSAERPATST